MNVPVKLPHKLPLLVLAGPTAVGKSAVAIDVARRLGGEIISGDSMQVYRGMDVGTAKVTPAEMRGVPHHLIDIADPDADFSVAEFRSLVDQAILRIHGHGHLPVLVGGTGLYIRSVLEEYTFTAQAADHDLRRRLTAEADQHGSEWLHARLGAIDPTAAARLHPNDRRRIIRALEVFETTGVPISATQTAAQGEPRYDDLLLGLTMDRSDLYSRIDQRVDQMLAQGLTAEVLSLLRRYPPSLQALQAIGYREMVWFVRGLLNLTEATALIKRNTRRFAKRQFTWFRREPRMQWIDVTRRSAVAVVEEIVKLAEGKWPQTVEAHKKRP